MKTSKAFTLIELLVVIAIIGTLSTIVVSSLASARERAQVAKIQQTLKGIQTNAVIYQLDNNTFDGFCNYPDGSGAIHESIQTQIESLQDLAGDDRAHCVIIDNGTNDNLFQKNFGLTVSFRGKHYAVDINGIMTLDDDDEIISGVDWHESNQACENQGKRLPPIEVFRAAYLNGAGWGGPIDDFDACCYWTSTDSFGGQGYQQIMQSGASIRKIKTQSRHARCAS